MNDIHPLSFMASEANQDILYYHQVIKAEDSNQFREAMSKEIDSFKEKEIFEVIPLKDKLIEKNLIPFIWFFKRKHNPLSDLIKHKARLYIYGGKQVKRIDYWNTCALVVQSSTIQLMIIFYQLNGLNCRHFDYVLAFT